MSLFVSDIEALLFGTVSILPAPGKALVKWVRCRDFLYGRFGRRIDHDAGLGDDIDILLTRRETAGKSRDIKALVNSSG